MKDVYFLGKQNQVQELLNCADVLLLPSEIESFGLAALEGMACGVPAVCSEVGGLPEVIRNGVDGFLVPGHDVKIMAARALRSSPTRVVASRWASRRGNAPRPRSAAKRSFPFTKISTNASWQIRKERQVVGGEKPAIPTCHKRLTASEEPSPTRRGAMLAVGSGFSSVF